MPDPVIAALLTVGLGLVTFVAGQVVLKLLIEPIQALRNTIGQVAVELMAHAQVIHNPGVLDRAVMLETSKVLRRVAGELESHLYRVPRYDTTARRFGLPSRKELIDARTQLIGLSNSVFRNEDRAIEGNARRVDKICDLLKLHREDGDRWPKDLTLTP